MDTTRVRSTADDSPSVDVDRSGLAQFARVDHRQSGFTCPAHDINNESRSDEPMRSREKWLSWMLSAFVGLASREVAPCAACEAADINKAQNQKPLAVRVVDAAGRAALGATVIACVMPDRWKSLERFEGKTDARGVASLDVRGKRCRVLALAQDGSFAGQVVASDQAHEVAIRLAPAAEITGRIVTHSLMPVSGRRILCYLTGQDDPGTVVALETETGAGGEFLFKGIPVGDKVKLLTVKPGRYLFHYDDPFIVTRLESIDRGNLLDDLVRPGFAEPGENRSLPPPGTMDEQEKVDTDLLRVYGLEAGKNIKRVTEPFPAGRSRLTESGMPGRPAANLQPALLLSFYNGRFLNQWQSIVGGMQGKSEWSLIYLLQHCGLGAAEITGPKKLLNTEVEGDFVIRVGVLPEKLVAELEQILRKEAKLDVELNFVDEPQDVLVAKGDFAMKRDSAIKSADELRDLIFIYADARPNGPGRNEDGPTGGLDEFLRDLGNYIGRRVINDVSTNPKRVLWWNRIVNREGAQSPDLVLKQISEQTGLTFRAERRTVRVLRIEPASGRAGGTKVLEGS
jgi:hypothetical protein